MVSLNRETISKVEDYVYCSDQSYLRVQYSSRACVMKKNSVWKLVSTKHLAVLWITINCIGSVLGITIKFRSTVRKWSLPTRNSSAWSLVLNLRYFLISFRSSGRLFLNLMNFTMKHFSFRLLWQRFSFRRIFLENRWDRDICSHKIMGLV